MEEEKRVSQSKQDEIICVNCGAKLTFKPGTDSLNCEFCGALNKIEIDLEAVARAKHEIDYDDFIANQDNSDMKVEVTTVKCEGCGAETTFDPNVVSSKCDFCESPLVSAEAHKHQVIEPRGMLPFKITDKESLELFKKWLTKLWFAPNKLKTYARQHEKLSGLYIPYWTFDTYTGTSYSGERGDDYQTTETYYEDGETKTRTVTKTRWSRVSGYVSVNFDDVLVPASKSLPVKYVDELEPWDLDNLVPYDTKFLSGFKTETYQIPLEEGLVIAKEKMLPQIHSAIRYDIGGDHQRISSTSITYDNKTFKHILLPIWISAYRFKDKVYRFMINGRTGEVQGERPWSVIKIALAIIVALAIIGGGIYYFSEYQ